MGFGSIRRQVHSVESYTGSQLLQRMGYHGHRTRVEIVKSLHASPLCSTSTQKSPLTERRENEFIK